MSSEIRQQIEAAIKDRPSVTPIGSVRPVKASLPEAIERIVDTLHPAKVILFGSYAYGMPNGDSDVDLLVIMDQVSSHKETYLKVCKLLRPREFPVDILVQASSELQQQTGRPNFFGTKSLHEEKCYMSDSADPRANAVP